MQWGTATKKNASGFNLRDLWIGGEGMLGVVTGAVLKLVPKPATRWTLLTAFKTETAAVNAARKLLKQRVQPAICEFLDRESVHCAESATGRPVFKGQKDRAVILLEMAGSVSEVKEQSKLVRALVKEHAVAYRAARNRDEAEQLCEVRRKCSGAMFELGDSKLNEDIVIPMRSYSKFITFLRKLKVSSGLAIPTFGHLADGNLHVNIMYHRNDPKESKIAEETVSLLMKTVV